MSYQWEKEDDGSKHKIEGVLAELEQQVRSVVMSPEVATNLSSLAFDAAGLGGISKERELGGKHVPVLESHLKGVTIRCDRFFFSF